MSELAPDLSVQVGLIGFAEACHSPFLCPLLHLLQPSTWDWSGCQDSEAVPGGDATSGMAPCVPAGYSSVQCPALVLLEDMGLLVTLPLPTLGVCTLGDSRPLFIHLPFDAFTYSFTNTVPCMPDTAGVRGDNDVCPGGAHMERTVSLAVFGQYDCYQRRHNFCFLFWQ